MLPGIFDRRVTIQSASISLDGAGQPVQTWSDVVTVWMRIKPVKGSERFVAHQVVGKSVVTFEARYRTGVTVQHRLLYDGKAWDIQDVRQVGRKKGLEIDATARAET